MGVSLPSDLIVDVMRNADPSRLRGAVAKLQSTADPTGSSMSFVAEAQPEQWNKGMESLFAPVSTMTASSTDAGGAYAGFEQMVLRNLLEQLLPSSESGAFGTGPSAGVWRSLAADQLANIYAQDGGIGIGSLLAEHDQSGTDGTVDNQWPYFSAPAIRAFTG